VITMRQGQQGMNVHW